MNGDKRYHGEIQVTIGGNAARINVFSDNLQEVFQDLATIQAQLGFADPATNPARREIANAELIAARQKGDKPLVPQVPFCPNCETNEFMELVTFTDKATGQPKQAWKCQKCGKWWWPDKNGKGR
jgi:RNase P subunit RPR2